MEKLLTIVVPVYKVEAYITKCLDSLIVDSLLMDKMDVLIINDGTPDRSAEMSRGYVKRFPGVFRQIDKENGGHGSVWNLGVKEAYGKYVKFLDSDDWLENLDIMLTKLEETDVDLIITSVICHNPGDDLWKLEIKDMEFDHVYDADRFDWLGNRSHGNFIFHHCAIYKTEMFRQYIPLFLEKQPYDDVVLGVASIIGSRTLVAWDLEVYHYLVGREGQSISKEVVRRNVQARINVQQSIIEFVENHAIVDKTSSKWLYFNDKLPKYYSFGYCCLPDSISYMQLRMYIQEWDDWVKQRNPQMMTKWVWLYRSLPFLAFWCIYFSYRKSIALLKRIK